MPNLNPRISVVIPPQLNATLGRLAALQGRSKASIAREFLVEVEPVLARVAGLLELAAKARQTGTTWPKEFVSQLEAAQGDLERVALEAMGQLDAFADTAGRMEPAVGRPAAASRPARKRRRTPHA